jgi:hypothetical protein
MGPGCVETISHGLGQDGQVPIWHASASSRSLGRLNWSSVRHRRGRTLRDATRRPFQRHAPAAACFRYASDFLMLLAKIVVSY